MKVRYGTDASGGGRSAPATPIKLGFQPEEEDIHILRRNPP